MGIGILFVLVSLVAGEDGAIAFPTGKGSGAVTAFSQADGFLTIDPLASALDADTSAEITLIGEAARAPDAIAAGYIAAEWEQATAPDTIDGERDLFGDGRIVILPLARPGLTVAALFSLLLSYNEFLFALVLTGIQTKTLPVAIASFGGEDVSDWSISAAGAIGIMLPIAVIMLFVQRHLVRGLTIGAVIG